MSTKIEAPLFSDEFKHAKHFYLWALAEMTLALVAAEKNTKNAAWTQRRTQMGHQNLLIYFGIANMQVEVG